MPLAASWPTSKYFAHYGKPTASCSALYVTFIKTKYTVKRFALPLLCLVAAAAVAQPDRANGDPKLSELYTPTPPIVKPGATAANAPSDAIVLFDGSNLNAWLSDRNAAAPTWTIADGATTVAPGTGGLKTKQAFGSCQLHLEWRSPIVVKGEGQGRGNSGVIFMGQYELQVLDNHNNSTYTNGQAASIYKQHIPLANACRPPGEWQTYDVIFTAPEFYDDGRLRAAARFTVFHNGVLVQNNVTAWGNVQYRGIPEYSKHAPKLPLMLQDHGDLVSFRNIWLREL
jgi:hypothetical protein